MGLQAQPLIGHDIEARLAPDQGTLAVTDTLSLPAGQDDWTFILHQGLNPQVVAGEAHLEALGSRDRGEVFRLRRQGAGPITLSYAGPLRGDLERVEEGMGRSRQWTRGIIGPDGVVLDGNSGWYPRFPDSLQRFALQVDLPSGWTAIAQGAGPKAVATAEGARDWREDQPQDDIYLIAAPFIAYRQPTAARSRPRSICATRTPSWPSATSPPRRITWPSTADLIGPYPYAKFALVENFWETGYGMPSFTLLGPQVIRLPFIIKSSYPHEILHNWWGNGVYHRLRDGQLERGADRLSGGPPDEGAGGPGRRLPPRQPPGLCGLCARGRGLPPHGLPRPPRRGLPGHRLWQER